MSQMQESIAKTFEKCLATIKRKNHDYSKGANEYRNFETASRIGIDCQTSIMVRLLDKITRLENLLTSEAFVTEETFEDTVDDAINYLAIIKARRELERTQNALSAGAGELSGKVSLDVPFDVQGALNKINTWSKENPRSPVTAIPQLPWGQPAIDPNHLPYTPDPWGGVSDQCIRRP